MKLLILMLALLALSCGRQEFDDDFTMNCVWVSHSTQRFEGDEFICYKFRNAPMECYDREY